MPKIGEVMHGRELGKKYPYNKYVWYPCSLCGKERWVLYRNLKNICASCQLKNLHSCIGRKNPSWNGGRVKHGGYIRLLLNPEDLFFPMANKRNYVFEHRYIVAKHINRCLLPWEVVHHINGKKDDNRIENLQLLANSTQHLPDTLTKAKIKKLEKENKKLRERIRILEGKQ